MQAGTEHSKESAWGQCGLHEIRLWKLQKDPYVPEKWDPGIKYKITVQLFS